MQAKVQQLAAFDELGREVRSFFHTLRTVAEKLHEEDDISAAQRAVLESLAEEGPRTVPALAASRPVTRQHIQVLMNGLEARGLVEAQENPRHRRSPLYALTAAGRRLFSDLHAREARLLSAVRWPFGADEMRAAAATLRALRETFSEL